MLLFGCCSLRILISLDHHEGFFFFERYSLGLLGNDTVLVDWAIFISLFLHRQDINGVGSIFNLLNKKNDRFVQTSKPFKTDGDEMLFELLSRAHQ